MRLIYSICVVYLKFYSVASDCSLLREGTTGKRAQRVESNALLSLSVAPTRRAPRGGIMSMQRKVHGRGVIGCVTVDARSGL